MITNITGILLHVQEGTATLDVGSFQYTLLIPEFSRRNLQGCVGEEISLQINASVSARVPGKDMKVLGQNGVLLASAPTLSIREVKTYARIANDTPFIIGGLIAKDSEEEIQRVPVISRLPLIGNLFRSR